MTRACRKCGCTETAACVNAHGPCWWVAPDLCSHCEDPDAKPPQLDPFADARLGRSMFEMRPEDWYR
jgi:hypothetical protein